MKQPLRARAFSLLEVMVAIAILGLALSVILSAQGGLAASNHSAANMGNAANYGRCKMTEIEEQLLKLGYPELDDLQTGLQCCVDDSPGFSCDTRVERIVLPNPPSNQASSGDGGLGLGGSLFSALGGGDGGLSNPLGGAGLNLDGGLQNLGATLQQQTGGAGAEGLLNMVLGMVYPSLKPMMETSIRKVTVTVKWKEGPNDRELTLVQYLTNPQRGGFVAGVVDPNNPAGAASGASSSGPAPGGPSAPSSPGGGPKGGGP
jgi:general secretion pathway protein I